MANSFQKIGSLFTLIIMLGVIAVGCTPPPVAQPSPPPSDEGFTYPVRPGTEAWARFETHDEMVGATQIPAPVLGQLSSAALVRAVLDYPLLGDLWAYNSPNHGVEAVTEQFNGLQELMQRPDAGRLLLDHYQRLDPNRIDPRWSEAEQGHHSLRIATVELLLAQPAAQERLSSEAREQLVATGLATLQAKAGRPTVYGGLSRQVTAFLVGRTFDALRPGELQRRVRTPAEVRAFLVDGAFENTTSAAAQVVAEVEQVFGPSGER